MTRLVHALLVLVFLLGLPPALAAQPERYELGRRLRQFEAAWETEKDTAARADACGKLDAAVRAFFSLKLRDAGKAIDEARFALKPGEPPTPEVRQATALFVQLDRRLLDRQEPSLAFTLDRFYPQTRAVGDLDLVFEVKQGDTAHAFEFANVANLPFEGNLRLPSFGEDVDLRLTYRVQRAGTVLAEDQLGISLVLDVQERLRRLRELDEKLPIEKEARTTARLTLRHLTQLLSNLAKPGTPETDYPAARLLAQAEAIGRKLADPARGDELPFGKDLPGQFWLMLPTGTARTVARIQVPGKTAPPGGWPVVFALHGAGGSENMFFDTYGVGKVATLAAERGWLLVAPRSALGSASLPDLLAELAKHYPVDAGRVFVVGHSMGAGQALAAAVKEPGKYRAIAALGGGRPIKVSEPLKAVPFFVGVGTKDFAYDGAKRLAESLKKAGVAQVEYREYPEIEHLVIVQHALPEVFAFFDQLAK